MWVTVWYLLTRIYTPGSVTENSLGKRLYVDGLWRVYKPVESRSLTQGFRQRKGHESIINYYILVKKFIGLEFCDFDSRIGWCFFSFTVNHFRTVYIDNNSDIIGWTKEELGFW